MPFLLLFLTATLSLFASADGFKQTFATTDHSIKTRSGLLSYTATTGTIAIYDDKEEIGELFFTYYQKEGGSSSSRPITFCYNGGPGGSSWLVHIAGIGPRRVLLPEEGGNTIPPYTLVDNQESLLELSDLVFVDPMKTGLSRAIDDEKEKLFLSVEGDIISNGQFIRSFLIAAKRLNSPLYILGESYGTFRACGVADYLQSCEGLGVNGLILISSAVDLHAIWSDRETHLPRLLAIPTFAVTARYHHKGMTHLTLEETADYARRFAAEELAPLFFEPAKADRYQKEAIYAKLASLIGLPVDTVRRYQGKLDEFLFTTEFFSPERKILGGIDSRFVGDASPLFPQGMYEDPSVLRYGGLFAASIQRYLEEELETPILHPKYEIFSPAAFIQWNWANYDTHNLPNMLTRLRRALVANPGLKVFIGAGYYDIRTPFYAAEYTFQQLELPEAYGRNIHLRHYQAGHAYYLEPSERLLFRKHLGDFYALTPPLARHAAP
jgi:carboxypeptidase C (cathepsin A)